MCKNSQFGTFTGKFALSPEDLGDFAHGFDERLQGVEGVLEELGCQVGALRKHLTAFAENGSGDVAGGEEGRGG